MHKPFAYFGYRLFDIRFRHGLVEQPKETRDALKGEGGGAAEEKGGGAAEGEGGGAAEADARRFETYSSIRP